MQQAVVVKLSSPATCHFPGAEYNETKVKDGTAEMVLARNVSQLFLQRTEFLRSIGLNVSTDVEQYLISNSRTFDNTKTKKWQFHVALSVREREMSKEQLADLADRFMQQFGYGQQPYFIYFHHDTDNNHVHILSTNVDRTGHRISDSSLRGISSTLPGAVGSVLSGRWWMALTAIRSSVVNCPR